MYEIVNEFDFGHIPPLTPELFALERLKNRYIIL